MVLLREVGNYEPFDSLRFLVYRLLLMATQTIGNEITKLRSRHCKFLDIDSLRVYVKKVLSCTGNITTVGPNMYQLHLYNSYNKHQLFSFAI